MTEQTIDEQLAQVREDARRLVNRRLTECGMRRAHPRTVEVERNARRRPYVPIERVDQIDGDMVYVRDPNGIVWMVWTVVRDRWERTL